MLDALRTPEGRFRVLAGWDHPPSHAEDLPGYEGLRAHWKMIPVLLAATAARWATRYRQAGPAGMADRSSRPHRCPGRTPAPVVRAIVHLRWRKRLGPVEIGARLGIPARLDRVTYRMPIEVPAGHIWCAPRSFSTIGRPTVAGASRRLPRAATDAYATTC